ncbi:DDE superfamily endonuclease [Ceratobasidium sp. AG-Ba]|nr:DDE superfamily endonuclease [Ceratobasidium sp. AG-Ba]
MPFSTARKTQLEQARNNIRPTKRRKLNNGGTEGSGFKWIEQKGERKVVSTRTSCIPSAVLPQSNHLSYLTPRTPHDHSPNIQWPFRFVYTPQSAPPTGDTVTEDLGCDGKSVGATPMPKHSSLLFVDGQRGFMFERQSDSRTDSCALPACEPKSIPLCRVRSGKFAPSHDDAATALKKINKLLHPPRNKGAGYKLCRLHALARRLCEGMAACLRFYVRSGLSFIQASNQAAIGLGCGIWAARHLRARVQRFIATGELPKHKYGGSSHSLLDDEDLTNEINMFLQRKGRYVVSEDIVKFLADPAVRQRLDVRKKITTKTVQRWLRKMAYRWRKQPTGQYFDGHERADVVEYRKDTYAPRMKALEPFFPRWDDVTGEDQLPDLPRGQRPVVIWFNDSSTFFANDRKTVGWFKIGNKHLPLMKKGPGASATAYDFVSAEYGFLKSRDGESRARKILFAGRGRDGYMTNDDICRHFKAAAKLAMQEYPERTHIFVYDNARIHTKRPTTAPSARLMPKGESETFGATVVGADGRLHKVRMMNPRLPDGSEQELYLPNGSFKGMATLLKERGYDVSRLKAQCVNFKCADPLANCCCRRILFRLIDMAAGQKSNLELLAEELGTEVIFLPKFHCELNPIEQCWGRAKYIYRKSPSSSLTADVETNMVKALDSISLKLIRQYFKRSRRFVDSYAAGLDGPNAAASEWARRKMLHHRTSPEHIEV